MSAPASARALSTQLLNSSSPIATVSTPVQGLLDSLGKPITGTLTLNAFVTQPWRYLLGQVSGNSNGGLTFSSPNIVRGAYIVQDSDANSTIALTSSTFYTLTVLTPSSYQNNNAFFVVNTDTVRGKNISIQSLSNFILWPQQSALFIAINGTWVVLPSAQRWLKPAAQFFIDPITGSDNNDGLAPSNGAFATIQHGVDILHTALDSQDAPPTLNLADGTHNVGTGVNINYPLVGSSQFFITGNISSPNNVIVQCVGGGTCFNARDLSTVTLSGMLLSTIGNGSTALSVTQGSTLDICASGPVNFNAFPLGQHIIVGGPFSSLNVLSAYSILGSSTSHITSLFGGYINYGSFTVTGASGLVFTIFAVANNGGFINAGGVPMSFSGFSGVTGQRYAANNNAVIASNSTTYPGNAGGTTANGGLYS